MPHLAELGAIEVIGTSGNDAFSGRDQSAIFGRQGQDVLTSNPALLSSDQWFFGGSGSDRYVVRPGTSVFVGDGFDSAGDVVQSSGIGFGRPYSGFAEVGPHLLAVDFESNTNLMILDWLSPQRVIERLELADGSRTLSADAIRSLDNYAGSFALEEVFAGAPPEVARLFRAFVRKGFERAAEIESTPQPALVQIIGTAAGDDLMGDARSEIITGAAGDDGIIGNGGDDQLHGNAGADLIDGNGGADLLDGGRDDDVLRGGNGADELRGSAGFDRLVGGAGNDVLAGGTDDDELPGGDDADKLDGGRGDDALNGGLGADRLNGGLGHDQLDGAAGQDVLSGGSDLDRLFGREGADTLNGNAGGDELNGGPGDDIMNGGPGPDTLLGGPGKDVMLGGAGNDVLDGGPGTDRAQGGRGADSLLGGSGADTLEGQDGNDHLEGGFGTDFLTGGLGADRFLIRSETTVDRITDFSEDDVLTLESLVAGVSESPTGDELDDFLQLVFDGANTTLNVDEDGLAEFASPETSVTLLSVDLVGAAASQAEVIDALLAGGQLEVT